MHQDRRRFAQKCSKFDHPLEQAFIGNTKLSKTPSLHLSKCSRYWLCRLGNTALLTLWVCSSGASFHTQTNFKGQKEALKNTFLTLVGPLFFIVLTSVLCTLPFKAFECRRTRKTTTIASRAGKMQLFEGKQAQHKTHPKPLFTVNYSVLCTFEHTKKCHHGQLGPPHPPPSLSVILPSATALSVI